MHLPATGARVSFASVASTKMNYFAYEAWMLNAHTHKHRKYLKTVEAKRRSMQMQFIEFLGEDEF